MESFLPTVTFYPSVHYNIIEESESKRPELDILGISDKATYIIEVKAHELTHKDRVGIKGTKDKFHSSVFEACCQCERAKEFIESTDSPEFSCAGKRIQIDKSKPTYKIAVTFQLIILLFSAKWINSCSQGCWSMIIGIPGLSLCLT